MNTFFKLSLGCLLVAALSLMIGGCEAIGLDDDGETTGTISVTLGNAATKSTSQTIVCYWVVGRVDVFANGEEVGTASFEIQNDPPVGTVTIPVTVPDGMTLFSASSFTVRDRLVFEGEADDLVNVGEDPPSVVIDLFGIGPALEFCFDYETGQASVANRGAATLEWIASSLDTCDSGTDCIFPSPERGSLDTGETTAIGFEAISEPGEYVCLGMTDGFHELRIPLCFGNFDLGVVCDPPEEPSC